MIRTVDTLDVQGHHVLTRVDFNVPLTPERTVRDDTRIRAALPTIQSIIERDGIPILMSHLGRPKSGPEPQLSLRPVAEHLKLLLDSPVQFIEDCIGPCIGEMVSSARHGDVIMLENLRFYPGEELNDPEFAASLARWGTIYINDAFATVHRAHASIHALPALFPGRRAAGLHMAREIEYLSKVFNTPPRPFVAIIGGAKISDKIRVLERLLSVADYVLLGGGVANTFLASQSLPIGESIVNEDYITEAATLYRHHADKILLPNDAIVADELEQTALTSTVSIASIPPQSDWRIFDIGPETLNTYANIIREAKLVLWNGPMGAFEYKPFRKGTLTIAEYVADATDSGAITVIGGGDTIAAVSMAGVNNRISHISTGGGATLEFLEGKPLPGIIALDEA